MRKRIGESGEKRHYWVVLDSGMLVVCRVFIMAWIIKVLGSVVGVIESKGILKKRLWIENILLPLTPSLVPKDENNINLVRPASA